MTKAIKIILVVVFISMLLIGVGGYFINKNHQKKVRSQPKKYCYQTFYGPANPVLMIRDLEFKEEYIKYYRNVESNNKAYFNFPLKTLPISFPVYVMSYSKDSVLANVVSYNDGGFEFGGYIRGWVYAKTLHENPPNEQ